MGTGQVGFLLLTTFAIYGITSSLQMPLGQLAEPGPGLFPLFLSGLLFLLTSVGLIVSWASKRATSSWRELREGLWSPTKIVLCITLAIYFFESVGFLITITSFLILLFLWVSGFRLWKAFIFGIAGGLVGWFLFVKMLGVPMPQGFLNL